MLLSELFNDDPFYTTVEEREVMTNVMSLWTSRFSKIIKETREPVIKKRIHVRKARK